jgi:hypothetical protein
LQAGKRDHRLGASNGLDDRHPYPNPQQQYVGNGVGHNKLAATAPLPQQLRKQHALSEGDDTRGSKQQQQANRRSEMLLAKSLSSSSSSSAGSDSSDEDSTTKQSTTSSSDDGTQSLVPLSICHKDQHRSGYRGRFQGGYLYLELYASKDAACVKCDICLEMMNLRKFLKHMHRQADPDQLILVSFPQKFELYNFEPTAEEVCKFRCIRLLS